MLTTQPDTGLLQPRQTVDSHRLGLVVGTFLGGWHLGWAALVLAEAMLRRARIGVLLYRPPQPLERRER